jgi:hypothetical protein
VELLTHRGEGLRQRNDKSEDKEAHLGENKWAKQRKKIKTNLKQYGIYGD